MIKKYVCTNKLIRCDKGVPLIKVSKAVGPCNLICPISKNVALILRTPYLIGPIMLHFC